MPTTPAPYDPKTLKTPLTADQRNKIVAWLHSIKDILANTGPTSVLSGEVDKASSMSDTELFGLYKVAYAATNGGTTKDPGTSGNLGVPSVSIPGLDTLAGLISAVTNKNFLLRVGEFIVGAIILEVAVKGAVTPAQATPTPVTKAVGKTLPIKVAKKVLKR